MHRKSLFFKRKSFSAKEIESSEEHTVWKLQNKSHSTLRAKRAMFTYWEDKECYQTGQFWYDKNWWKIPKLKKSKCDILVDFLNTVRHGYPSVCSGGKYRQQQPAPLLSKSICFQLLLIWNLIPTQLLSEQTPEQSWGKKKILCLYFRHHLVGGVVHTLI